MGLFLIINSIF